MHENLERLAELDRVDRDIAKRQRAIEQGNTSLAEAVKGVEACERTKAEVEATLADNRSQQLALQRTIKDHEANRDRAHKALEMGHGDPAAAERQVARTSELIDEAETEQLELLEAQDTHEAALATASEALDAARSAVTELEERVPAANAEHEAALDGLRQERASVVDALPKDLNRRYEDFRVRNKWAVAPIVDGACGACRMEVPAQQRADLARGLIEPCRRCYRWVVLT